MLPMHVLDHTAGLMGKVGLQEILLKIGFVEEIRTG